MDPVIEIILKNKLRLFYYCLYCLNELESPICSTKCYTNKELFKNNSSTIKKLRTMKENDIGPFAPFRSNNMYLKRIPFPESKNKEVKINVDISGNGNEPAYLLKCNFKKRNIETLNEIAKIVMDMNVEEYYQSISVIKLEASKKKITQTIPTYDSTESESFFIYHIIEGNPLKNLIKTIEGLIFSKNLIISEPEPFSPISLRRLYRNNPAKVDEYYDLSLTNESNIITYYINPIFKERINNEDILKINNEIKFDIKFYHFPFQYSLQNFKSNFFPIVNYTFNPVTPNNMNNFIEQQSFMTNIYPNVLQNGNPFMYPVTLLNNNQINNNVLNVTPLTFPNNNINYNYYNKLNNNYQNPLLSPNNRNNSSKNSNISAPPLLPNNMTYNGINNNFNSLQPSPNYNHIDHYKKINFQSNGNGTLGFHQRPQNMDSTLDCNNFFKQFFQKYDSI